MYKKSITPEESLNLIKVRMKYDLSKTLNENIGFISEQAVDATKVNDIVNKFYKLMIQGDVTKKEIINTIDLFKKEVFGKIYRDKCLLTSVDRYLQQKMGQNIGDYDIISVIKNADEYGDGEFYDLKDDLLNLINTELEGFCKNPVITKKETKPEESKKETKERQQNINNIWCSVKNGMITAGGRYNNSNWDKFSTEQKVKPEELEIAKKSCSKGGNSDGKKRTSIQIPSELKTVEGIKHFQDWLDTNHPGWASGYTDGVLLKGKNGGGYGSFGPRTSKAWASYKTDYLSGKTKTASKVEVDPNEVDTDEVNVVEK